MIFVNEPLLDGNEKKYLLDCIETGWISSEGPYVTQFESRFSNRFRCAYGIAVCNGTAALETALAAAGLKEGDEIILPSFTIISCVTACLRLGLVPVLVDVDPKTLTLDVSQIRPRLTPKTKAIMAVHIYGHACDMDPLFELKETHDLIIIEDAAEAHGAQYFSKRRNQWLYCGEMGDVAAFSFYANKIITTGEGGMVVTDDPTIAERAKRYRNLCFVADERFRHDELGTNFRMTNVQAAIGVAQLERLDHFLEIKQACRRHYETGFDGLNGLSLLPVQPWCRSVFWMYGVMLDESTGITAKDMIRRLSALKIGARPFFRGMHTQPILSKMGLFRDISCPVTDHAYQYGFYIPSGLTLTPDQMDTVIAGLKDALL